MRRAFCLFWLAFLCAAVFGDDQAENVRFNVAMSTFLPGYAQFAQGDLRAGWMYATATPFLYGGYGMLAWSLAQPWDPSEDWRFDAGLLSVKAAEALQYHGIWAYTRDVNGRGHESLGALLMAPWDPNIALSPEVMVVPPLVVALTFDEDAWLSIPDYFRRDRVSLYGLQLDPALAFGLSVGYFALLNEFVAVSEELVFRGITLEARGLVYSSVVFGLVHLTNLAFTDGSPEAFAAAARQVVAAGCIGLYNGIVTMRNGYDIRKAVAVHYWANLLNMTVGTLVAGAEGATASYTGIPPIPLLYFRW